MTNQPESMYFVAIPMAHFTGVLSGSYQAMNIISGSPNIVGFQDPIKILKIYNNSTTVGIIVSYDGVTDQDYFPPGATQIIDLQTNHSVRIQTLGGAQGQIIYGKGTGTADIYIIGYL
jgi:hypothetical protein